MKKIVVLILVLTTLLLAIHTSYAAVQAEREAVINFDGLPAGEFDSVSHGVGIGGAPVDGSVMILGSNPVFPDQNAAMIFDATCPGGCTGEDDDLYARKRGMVLIVSEDMDSGDPDDSDSPGTLEFDFQNLGSGRVTVDSITIGDIDRGEEGGILEFYAGGSSGTLLDSVPIPVKGNNVYFPLSIGVSGVDYMRVSLVSSASIDEVVLRPEEEEVLYLSDTMVKGDGFTNLFKVEINKTSTRADLILLPNGVLNYDHVDAIATTPDGARVYFVDEPISPSILGYYDVETATVHEVGNIKVGGTTVLKIDQAAFSPDGTLYITSNITDKLYRVDLTTAEAFEIGILVDDVSGDTLNVVGADIAFHADGSFYIMINNERQGARRGLYLLSLPPQNGQVLAEFKGPGTTPHNFRGLAVRKNGTGDLVGSAVTDEPVENDKILIIDRTNAEDVVSPMPVYRNDIPYDLAMGDMSIGPFMPLTVTISSR